MKLILPLFLASLLCASIAMASPLTGTFQMNGVVTATSTAFTWTGVNGTTPNMFTLSLGTGTFAGEDGQNNIQDLNSTTEPVGTTFPPQDFIDFSVTPGLPSLWIDFIPMGNGGAAGCSQPATGTVPPQTCTPPIPGGSPITFQNNNENGTVTGSSATWTSSGVTSDGSSHWTGIFTSQFVGQSYQDVLHTFATTGSVTAAYSANVAVGPNVPEPATVLTGGLGALFVILVRRRRRQV